MEYILIAMNADCSDLFQHFSDEYPEYALPVDHKAFIGFDAVNSPEIKGVISSMMRASASVKLSASTR